MNRSSLSLKIYFIILFLLYIFLGTMPAQELPSPRGYVNDFAGVISSSEASRMREIGTVVEKKTGAEIAVVTVETIGPYGSVEEYAVELAETWGIGQEGKDNGVLIVLAMKERQVRLEVGYGLEGAIPDGLAGEILDTSILPELKKGNYGRGLLKGMEATAGIIGKEYEVDLGNLQLEESSRYTSGGNRSGGAIPRVLLPLIFLLLFGGGRFFLPFLFLSGATRRGSFGGGFGAGHSSGGFGGGGFGGGSFGGGGASRGF